MPQRRTQYPYAKYQMLCAETKHNPVMPSAKRSALKRNTIQSCQVPNALRQNEAQSSHAKCQTLCTETKHNPVMPNAGHRQQTAFAHTMMQTKLAGYRKCCVRNLQHSIDCPISGTSSFCGSPLFPVSHKISVTIAILFYNTHL